MENPDILPDCKSIINSKYKILNKFYILLSVSLFLVLCLRTIDMSIFLLCDYLFKAAAMRFFYYKTILSIVFFASLLILLNLLRIFSPEKKEIIFKKVSSVAFSVKIIDFSFMCFSYLFFRIMTVGSLIGAHSPLNEFGALYMTTGISSALLVIQHNCHKRSFSVGSYGKGIAHEKNRFSVILIAELVVVLLLTLILTIGLGNIKYNYYSEETHGDFTVRFFENRSECDIIGLSELGRTRKMLCIPKCIDGAIVKQIGVRSVIFFGANKFSLPDKFNNEVADFANNIVEKLVYLPDKNTVLIGDLSEICPKVTKMFFLDTEIHSVSGKAEVYLSSLYRWYAEMQQYSTANVSYYLNYEDVEGDGYYMIDDCDYGGLIDCAPQDPVRDGYTFGGWYKESECINRWNFENDTLPAKMTEIKVTDDGKEEVTTVYQETRLYAKWVV